MLEANMLEKDEAWLEWLNDQFKQVIPFCRGYYCDHLCHRYCNCCDQELECDEDPNTCQRLKEAEDAYNAIKRESFHYKKLKGVLFALNSSRIIGAINYKVPIEALSRAFERDYRTLNPSEIGFSAEECIVQIKTIVPAKKRIFQRKKPVVYKIEHESYYSKFYVETSIALLKNPKYFYYPEKALIMQNDTMTFILAPKVKEGSGGRKDD